MCLLTFNLLVLGIVQRLLHHRCSIPRPKQLHFNLCSWCGITYRQIPIGDTLAHAIAIASTGYTTQDTFAIEERLTTQSHGSRIIDDQATQSTCNALRFDAFQCLSTYEITFFKLDGKAKTRFVRIIFGVNVSAPVAIALLQAQRLDSPVAGCYQAKWLTCFPQRIPE